MGRICYRCKTINAGNEERCTVCNFYIGNVPKLGETGAETNVMDDISERDTCMRCGIPVHKTLYCDNCRRGMKSTMDMIRDRHRKNWTD
jgi:hypothetical protein